MTLAPAQVASPVRVDDSGVARIGGSRVTLGQVVAAFLQGASAEEIALRFDVLTLSEVYATLAYYLANREEVDAFLAEETKQAESARAGVAQVVEIDELRARLERRGS